LHLDFIKVANFKRHNMQTITIDILNKKAIKLLQDLENLQLIRMRRESNRHKAAAGLETKYKGAMTKQPLTDIDNQLKELRNEWE
jgi:hypothetical protein